METRRSVASKTLEKADFFLDFAETYAAVDRDAFERFLEAAIVNARTVTFHLQKEFGKHISFNDWYRAKQEEMRKDPLFQFFVNRRNYILKEGPISIKKTINLDISETVIISDSMKVQVVRGRPWYKRGPKILFEDLRAALFQKCNRWKDKRELSRKRHQHIKRHQNTVKEVLHFEEPEWRNRPATDLVREYLQKLGTIVNDAEMRFLT